MNYEKYKHIAEHLSKLTKGHGLTITTGSSDKLKDLAQQYEGAFIFITDSTFSQEYRNTGKDISYENTVVLKLRRPHEGDSTGDITG